MKVALRQSIVAVAAVAALASCGGGGGAPAIPQQLAPTAAPSTSSAPGTTQITIKIVVPASTAARYHLHTVTKSARPNYVSASTASVQITVNGQASSAVVANISCATFPCSASVTLSAPTNQQDTFAVIGYDGPNATGTPIEDGSVTQLVPEGLTTISISLGGIVSGFNSVNICPPATPGCGQGYQVSSAAESSWTISVNQAIDPDGNVIIGNYDSPIVLVKNEADITQNAFELNPTSLTSSSSTAELTYTGAFDGEDAPSVSILPESCNSNGTPQTSCTTPGQGNYRVTSLYAVLQAPCPTGTPACSTYGFYGGATLGAYGGGMGQVNGIVYADDAATVFDSVTPTGIVLETPANAFELINQPGGYSSSLAPPLSLSAFAGSTDVATVGTTLIFNDSTYGYNIASYAPGSGTYAEYSNALLTNNSGGGGVAGSDGNYYEGELGASTQFLAQFDPSSRALQEYTLASGHAEQWISALGSNIWFAAQDQNTSEFYVGYMPVTSGLTVSRKNETAVPATLGSGDYWLIDQIAGAQSTVFFDAIDLNDTTSAIGMINPSNSSVSIYPLPSSWPSGAVLTAMAYNPSDGYVYFVDSQNGIIGRIPGANPSALSIQGYGVKFNEAFGTTYQTMIADSSGRIWVDSAIPEGGGTNCNVGCEDGVTVLTPSEASWSSSPSSGIPAFKKRSAFPHKYLRKNSSRRCC
jgi:hypothetical protein